MIESIHHHCYQCQHQPIYTKGKTRTERILHHTEKYQLDQYATKLWTATWRAQSKN